jgi:extracellular elastinolytic metalloproteinase
MKAPAVIILAAAASAIPTSLKHELKYVKRGKVEFPFHYSENVSFTVKTPTASAQILPALDDEIVAQGKEHLMKILGLNKDELEITRFFKSKDGVMHIYATHKINNIAVVNHDAAVHILNGEIIAESASFTGDSLDSSLISESTSIISLEEAVKIASKEYDLPRDEFPAKYAYVEIPGNKIVYVHQFQLRDDKKQQWMEVSVDARSGQIVQVVDYVDQSTYNVVQLPKMTALDGFNLVTDPENATASPNGWTDVSSTIGNNVDSRINYSERAEGGDQKIFNTLWEIDQEPTTPSNKNAAIVNNFYVSNMVHDISYQYGFTEVAGNFQNDNYERGGNGNDRVVINNQASGTNNANFATPPDGQNPTMNMYLWTFNTPRRDGSLDNGVPIHEYGHGISNRLTGGPANSFCLRTSESGGMGEGWSDTFAFILTQNGTETRESDYALGAYVYNNPKGIRAYKYSTSMTTNPYTYNSINSLFGVHAVGTVWATIMYEMYWNLVDAHGFAENLMDATQIKGNVIALQIVIGGMKIQPCNPTFLNARDAILSADETYYGGANKCLLWKAFAKRGLGVDASQVGRTNGFSLPADC